jgi:plastocyanin
VKKSTNLMTFMMSTTIISVALGVGIIFSWNESNLQSAAAFGETKSNATTSIITAFTTNSSESNTINLSAKEVTDGVYKWINDSNAAQNPTIKVFTNANNSIKIQNPTDTKHELIIDTGADMLPSTDDILPNSSGHLTFNPTMTGTFTYHCAYHPYTMKGTIEVVNK